MPENAPHVSSGLVFGRHIRLFLPASRPQRPGSRAIFAPVLLLLAALSGCRSAYVQASVENDTDQPVSLIEVDYPEASFGTQTLAAHAAYPYRFKIQGSGQVSITFTGADGRNHAEKGPILRQGQEGRLGIHIEPGNRVSWSERLMQQR